jgi:hypothetical protein
MGKGKGSFDHWASRIAVNKIIFELRGDLHEKVVKDAFRLAGNKMPGQYSFCDFRMSFFLTIPWQANMSSLREETRLLLELRS